MRLIDADALKADHIVTSTTTNTPCQLYVSMEQIQKQPTALVRCGECKHRTEISPTGWHPCVDMAVNDDWFCADGERENGK